MTSSCDSKIPPGDLQAESDKDKRMTDETPTLMISTVVFEGLGNQEENRELHT